MIFSPQLSFQWGLQMFVGGGLEGVAGFGAGFLEFGEELLAALEDHRGELMVGEIEVVGGEDGGGEFGEAGDVDGEASHGHGFVVGHPVGFVFGDALEDAAGVLRFRRRNRGGGFRRWSLVGSGVQWVSLRVFCCLGKWLLR